MRPRPCFGVNWNLFDGPTRGLTEPLKYENTLAFAVGARKRSSRPDASADDRNVLLGARVYYARDRLPSADEVRAIRFLIENDGLSGVFNVTAPRALQERDLARTIGNRLRRRAWLPVPGLALRLAYGRMAKETLLAGQRAEPRRLLESGFSFAYPDAESALRDLIP